MKPSADMNSSGLPGTNHISGIGGDEKRRQQAEKLKRYTRPSRKAGHVAIPDIERSTIVLTDLHIKESSLHEDGVVNFTDARQGKSHRFWSQGFSYS